MSAGWGVAFAENQLGWVTLPDSVPAFELYYDTRALWPQASNASRW